MRRYVIVEKNKNGFESIVCHCCIHGEFERMFRTLSVAKQVKAIVEYARQGSKFKIVEVKITT